MNAGGVVLLILGIVVLIAVYWLPSMVASSRKVPNVGSIVIINLFAGWTLVGWVVAMAMAVRDMPARPQQSAQPQPPPPFTTDGYR